MRTRTVGWLLLSTVVAWSVAGCCGDLVEKATQKAAEKAIEKATEGDASVSLGGNADISDLPEKFRYPGATSKAKVNSNGPQGANTVFLLESSDPGPKVRAHYGAITGFKQTNKSEINEMLSVVYEVSPGETYTITVTPGSPMTSIVITRMKKGS